MLDVKGTTGDTTRYTHVHCECILAVEILAQDKPGKYYIGCAKLCCTSCYYFIEAAKKYGERKGIEITMDGTHGISYLPWSIPARTPPPLCHQFEVLLLHTVNEAMLNKQDNQAKSNSDEATDLVPHDS